MGHPAFATAPAVPLRGPCWLGAPAFARGRPAGGQSPQPPGGAAAAVAAASGWALRGYQRLSSFRGDQLGPVPVVSRDGAGAVVCAADAPETIPQLKKKLWQRRSDFLTTVIRLTEATDPALQSLLKESIAECRKDIAEVKGEISRLTALERLDDDINKIYLEDRALCKQLQQGLDHLRALSLASPPSSEDDVRQAEERQERFEAERRDMAIRLADKLDERLLARGIKKVSFRDVLSDLGQLRDPGVEQGRPPPDYTVAFQPVPDFTVPDVGHDTSVRIWSVLMGLQTEASRRASQESGGGAGMSSGSDDAVLASNVKPGREADARVQSPEGRAESSKADPRIMLGAVVATPGLGKTLSLRHACQWSQRLPARIEELPGDEASRTALLKMLSNKKQTLDSVSAFAASAVVFAVNFNDWFGISPVERLLVDSGDAFVRVPLLMRILYMELAVLNPKTAAPDFSKCVNQACAALRTRMLTLDDLNAEVQELLDSRAGRGQAWSPVVLAIDELGKAAYKLPSEPYARMNKAAAAMVTDYSAADGLRSAGAVLTDAVNGVMLCTSVTTDLVEREFKTPSQRPVRYVELEGPTDVTPILRRALELLDASGLHISCYGSRFQWKVDRRSSLKGRDVVNSERVLSGLCGLTGGHPRFAAWFGKLLTLAGPGANVWGLLKQASYYAAVAVGPGLNIVGGEYDLKDEFFTKLFRGEKVLYHDTALVAKDGTRYTWDKLASTSSTISSGGRESVPRMVAMQLMDAISGDLRTDCALLQALSGFAPSKTIEQCTTWERMSETMEHLRSLLRQRRARDYRGATLRMVFASSADGKDLPVTHVGASPLLNKVQLLAHKCFSDIRGDKALQTLLEMAQDPQGKLELLKHVWHLPDKEAGIDAVIFFECAAGGAGVVEGDVVAAGLSFKHSLYGVGKSTRSTLAGHHVQDSWDKLFPVLGDVWHLWRNRFPLVTISRRSKTNNFDAAKATPIKPLSVHASKRDKRMYERRQSHRRFAQDVRAAQTVVLSLEDLALYYGPTLFSLVQAADLLLSGASVSATVPGPAETAGGGPSRGGICCCWRN